MRKMILPTILILTLASVLFLLVAKEYGEKKHAENPIFNKETASVSSEEELEESDTPVVSGERLKASDTCIVTGRNLSEKEITLRNIKGGDDKTLSFDGTTVFSSKNDNPLTAAEIMIGDIVDVEFTTYDAKLSSVKMSKDAWEIKNITKFNIDDRGKTIEIGDDLYKMASNSVIASGDRIGKLLDVTEQDEITVKGIDKEVFSIQIDSGHGYIRVSHDSYFVGGWIEIGQDIITVLTESMLIPVPEGTYDIKVTNKGYVGRETIDVVRDEETILDLSKIEIEEVAIGHVKFDITPDYAQLYVDGLMTDFEERVPLEYGIHSVRVELAGYETVHANIRVGSEMANIAIELDEEADTSSSSSSSSSQNSVPIASSSANNFNNYNNTSSASSSSSSTTNYGERPSSSTITSTDAIITDNKKLYVEGPEGVEVYLDGSYIGIAPCNTTKVTGNHTITLSKSGYETKSYTISVGNDGKDLTMSFSELSAVKQ